MQEDRLDSSLRRSKDAYARIKMGLTTRPEAAPQLATEHKVPVERINKVIGVLESIEKGKKLLKPAASHEEGKRIYDELKHTHKTLQKAETASVVSASIAQIEKRMKKLEKVLDEVTQKRLKKAFTTGNVGWSKYLVNPKKKALLFVNTLQEHVEKTTIPEAIVKEIEEREPVISQIEKLAQEAFKEKEVAAITEIFQEIIEKGLKEQVTRGCYLLLKEVGSLHQRVVAVITMSKYFSKNYQILTGRKDPDKDLLSVLKNTCKTLFIDAESTFSSSKIDTKTLVDYALVDLIGIVEEIDKYPAIFESWSRKRQPILKAVSLAVKEKSIQTPSKLKQLVYTSNAATFLSRAKSKYAASQEEIVEAIAKELKNGLLREIDGPKEANKKRPRISVLLDYIEALAQVVSPMYLTSTQKKTVIAQFKKDVRVVAERVGGLDDVSDNHLTSLINSFFGRKGAVLDSG
ncbi:hypothetical protein NEDG_01985 [Nematocida displodere]|uniref:Uncharacterized protein n=1 Tax=Nematocida displodere TaxID=1805483 RepID=A0A177EER1_9MICR|nr:hypothetical protein NEDG_01985 [Nematocida displodere]